MSAAQPHDAACHVDPVLRRIGPLALPVSVARALARRGLVHGTKYHYRWLLLRALGHCECICWAGTIGSALSRRSRMAIGGWSVFLTGSPREEELETLRRYQRTGRPLGDSQFALELERKLGRW